MMTLVIQFIFWILLDISPLFAVTLTGNGTVGGFTVQENLPLKMTCYTTTDVQLISFRIKNVNSLTVITSVGFIGSNCITDPVPPSYMNCSCVSRKEFVCVILAVTRAMDGDIWLCTLLDLTSSGYKTIVITIGISSVSVVSPVGGSVSVVQNTSRQFQCETSTGNPRATVEWYKDNGTPDDRTDDSQISTGSTTESQTSGKLLLTVGKLTMTVQSSDQGVGVYCRANNIGTWKYSSSVTIDVQFEPSSPKIIYLMNSDEASPLRVISGRSMTLTCSSTGNPIPTFTWTYPGGETQSSSTLVLASILPTNAGTFTCTAKNTLSPEEGNASVKKSQTIITIQVLYPPSTPVCKFSGAAISTSVKVLWDANTTISCTSSANPPLITYTWLTPGRGQEHGASLSLTNVQHPTDQGQYTLMATNTMDPTGYSRENGTSKTSFLVDVQFPPVVKPLTKVVVLERGNVSVACQVTAGVPNRTDFKWERMSDMTPISVEQTLNIANIDRTQDGYYRCTASNLMEPTGCDVTIGNSSKSIYIDVQYGAKVTNFTLLQSDHGQIFEVNENTPVTLYCQAQSNPLSTMSMLKQGQDLITHSYKNDLEFTISKSVCEDEGTYQCRARNTHNTKADISSFTLFVRCAPRPSSLVPKQQNVTSATGVPAVLTFNLVAFPRPRVGDFLWEKEYSALDVWHSVSNGTYINIIISADRLQTKLFFSSVKQVDFGYYRVHINNELGNYTETFRLQAQGSSAGPVIGGVGGSIAAIVAVTIVVVILRRKYAVNCNTVRKKDVPAGQSISGTDHPGYNADPKYEEVSMITAISVYEVLKDGENGPDKSHVYTALDGSSSKPNACYENFKTEDPVYNNTMLNNSAQTVL
ncbi:hemicentin-1-like [Mya arenaria]|uniref:hemicentin-1-like n=1 Tax=Mya arenaria TaxID=6604 RepID=UPI0022E97D5E|nr:hemicentin-1-like [Mya arenaria]